MMWMPKSRRNAPQRHTASRFVCWVSCYGQMMGLDDVEWRNRVQDAIIGIKGVVSITFDHNRNMVVVFIRDTKDKMRYNLVKQAIA